MLPVSQRPALISALSNCVDLLSPPPRYLQSETAKYFPRDYQVVNKDYKGSVTTQEEEAAGGGSS